MIELVFEEFVIDIGLNNDITDSHVYISFVLMQICKTIVYFLKDGE